MKISGNTYPWTNNLEKGTKNPSIMHNQIPILDIGKQYSHHVNNTNYIQPLKVINIYYLTAKAN